MSPGADPPIWEADGEAHRKGCVCPEKGCSYQLVARKDKGLISFAVSKLAGVCKPAKGTGTQGPPHAD